jgi:hypothetical protein
MPTNKEIIIPVLIGIIVSISFAVVPMNWEITAFLWIVLLGSIVWLVLILKRSPLTISILIIVLISLSVWGYSIIKEKRDFERNKVVVSPSNIVIAHNTSKNLVLSVTNNNNYAIFDICLSVCVDNETLTPQLINIVPIIDGGLSGANSAGLIYVFSNKCVAIVFGGIKGINSNSTKDCYIISMNGENLKDDIRVVFNVYDWSKSPSTNFKSKNNGDVEISQNMTAPLNQYFPKEKQLAIKEVRGISFKTINIQEIPKR